MAYLKPLLLLVTLTIFSFSNLFAQSDEPLAEEMTNLLKNESFNVSLLLQSRANFSFENDDFNGGRSFGFGNGLLIMHGDLDNNFNYFFQMDFSRDFSLLDINVGYEFAEEFEIVAGIQKPDIALDLQPNPGATDVINRARLVGTLNNVREIGVSAKGDLGNFDYNLSMFNGQGFDRNNDGYFMYLAKLGYTADLGGSKSLYIGANGAINNTEDHAVGNTGLTATDRLIYGAYATFDSDVWFGTFEFLETSFEEGSVANERITGMYATLGNKVNDQNEVVGRWDHISYDVTDFNSNRFVLGWNHFATSVITLQINALADFHEEGESFGLSGNFQFMF